MLLTSTRGIMPLSTIEQLESERKRVEDFKKENDISNIIDLTMCEVDSNAILVNVLNEWISDLETEDIYILPKLLEKMKDFRDKYFR
jgi:hypothetical protein